MNKTAQVNWIFTAQNKGTVVPNATKVTVQPHTGDSSIIPYVIILAGASILLIAIAMKKKASKEV